MRGAFDGTSVTLEPNADLPYTTFLCEKGLRWAVRATSAERLTEPLLRRNGSLVPVSWNEALDVWAEKIRSSVSRHGPLSLMHLSSAGSLYFSKKLLPHLFAALGGYTGKKGNLCSSAGSFGLAQNFGEVPVTRPESLAGHARGVLLWGRNALETHAHLVPLLRKVRERGGEIAAVEIRSTPTTRFADRWWRIEPGSDWALAAWLCKSLMMEGGACEAWRERSANPHEFENAVRSLDGGALLEAAGVGAESAGEILRWLKTFAPVTHYPAFGAQRYLHGDLQFRWIGALAVLLGAFSGPGAGLAFSKDEMELFPKFLEPKFDRVRALPVASWPVELDGLEPPVEVLSISGANPARQSPGSDLVRIALRKIPFTVCIDFVLSDTARESDLVLPTTTFLEEEGDWKGSYWHNYLVRSERILPPRGDALEETEIFTRLARRLGLSIDLVALKGEMDRAMLASPLLERVGNGVYRWDEPEYWKRSGAGTRLPAEIPIVRRGPEGTLRLVTVHRKEYINGQIWDTPLAGMLPPLSLHPLDAEALGLRSGEKALAYGTRGKPVPVLVQEDSSLGRGYCVLPQGSAEVNLLTDPLVGPGWGAPFAENWITVKKE
jgi:anaerobic selenocysteine-containing dehydrogenase